MLPSIQFTGAGWPPWIIADGLVTVWSWTWEIDQCHETIQDPDP